MEIIKIKNNRYSYDFYLKEDDKELRISFGGNLDLYWSLTKKNINLKQIKPSELYKESKKELKETFTLTKENYYIYTLFENLYNDIKECKLYTEDSYFDETISYKDRNKEYQNTEKYKYLFDGKIIKWDKDYIKLCEGILNNGVLVKNRTGIDSIKIPSYHLQ